MMYDRLDCLMAMAEQKGYGVHYGKLVADTTAYERDQMEEEGRALLTKRVAWRKAARKAAGKRRVKGEGKWTSSPDFVRRRK